MRSLAVLLPLLTAAALAANPSPLILPWMCLGASRSLSTAGGGPQLRRIQPSAIPFPDDPPARQSGAARTRPRSRSTSRKSRAIRRSSTRRPSRCGRTLAGGASRDLNLVRTGSASPATPHLFLPTEVQPGAQLPAGPEQPHGGGARPARGRRAHLPDGVLVPVPARVPRLDAPGLRGAAAVHRRLHPRVREGSPPGKTLRRAASLRHSLHCPSSSPAERR